MHRRLALVLALAVSAVGAPAGAEPALDEAARLERTEQVRRAELAFASTVAEKRPEAFAAMIDEEAVFVGSGGPTRGRDRIAAEWAPFFAAGAPEFEWHPEVVELAGDGTLGLTRGPWTIRGRDAEGREFERRGIFNSIWQRQADGSWRVIYDAGCACPACPG